MADPFPHDKFAPVRCPARARPGRIDMHPWSFAILILGSVIIGAVLG